jgi:hypothetical protein
VPGGATIIDSLAELLCSGVLPSVRMAQAITHLMMAAMRFMGRSMASGVSITVSFIQYVPSMLFGFMSTVALRALDALS